MIDSDSTEYYYTHDHLHSPPAVIPTERSERRNLAHEHATTASREIARDAPCHTRPQSFSPSSPVFSEHFTPAERLYVL